MKKTPKAPEPEPEPKAPKNTMTEEQKRQLSDYVCEVVKVELHPYLKRRIIESKVCCYPVDSSCPCPLPLLQAVYCKA